MKDTKVKGGLQAAETTKKRYGIDIHKNWGLKGVESYRKRQELGIAKPKGFALMSPEKRSAAGKKGGISKK